MSYLELTRMAHSEKGRVYSNTIIVPASTTSDTYFIPIDIINDIGISWDSGTPEIEFTFSKRALIEENDAQWVLWDNESIINKAVTAVRITNNEVSDMEICITVRTR